MGSINNILVFVRNSFEQNVEIFLLLAAAAAHVVLLQTKQKPETCLRLHCQSPSVGAGAGTVTHVIISSHIETWRGSWTISGI